MSNRETSAWGRLVCLAAMAALGAVLATGLAVGQARAQGASDLIVQTNDPAPDGNGTFSWFGDPALNDAGQAAFWAWLTGTSGGANDNEGIFRGTGGPITQIAREGQAAPDGNGSFAYFEDPSLNDAGQVAFKAWLRDTAGGSDDNQGIFRGAGGRITQIAREGQPTPDGNGTFAYFEDPSLNDAGQAAFYATLTGTSGGTSDDNGIFRGAGSTITQIAREGQAAPDGNGMFDFFTDLALNHAGQAAFFAELTGTSGGWTDNTGIFRGAGGTITQIAREGQAAPDGNGTFSWFGDSTLNDPGQAAFYATLTGTSGGTSDDNGIFRGAGSTITQIAREGQAAPDGNGTFSSLSSPSLNDAGQAAFWASLTGTSGGTNDNEGIFRGDGGALTQIARAGQAPPDLNGTFAMFGGASLNDAGQAAFYATLTGTSGGMNDNAGIYLGDGLEIVQVAREGQALAGSTITAIGFAPGPEEESGLNDFAQVAYRAVLPDGRQAIVRFTPEVHWRSIGSGYWDAPSNWTLSISPGIVHPVLIDPNGSLTVTGPAGDVTVDSLQVGGNPGQATLRLQRGARITAAQGVSVEVTGRIEGDGILQGTMENTGHLAANNLTVVGHLENYAFTACSNLMVEGDLDNYGEVVVDQVMVQGTLNNSALIRGNGWLDADIVNDGEMRTGNGQRLLVTGRSVVNSGRMEALGGEIEVFSPVTNTSDGQIAARDAVLRFHSGLVNDGHLAVTFGTTTDITGEVDNTGSISVAGGAMVTFYDDLTHTGTMIVTSAGDVVSQVAIVGMLSGTGDITGGGHVYILGGISPGLSPGEMLIEPDTTLGGGSELLMELADEGLYDRLRIAGNLDLAGTLTVELLDGYEPALGAEFDLLDWGGLSGAFSEVLLPQLPGGLGWDSSQLYASGSLSVVPEPGSAALLALVAVCASVWLLRRR